MNQRLFTVMLMVLIGALAAMLVAFFSLLNLTQTMLQASAHPTGSSERPTAGLTLPPIIQAKPWDMAECMPPQYFGLP